MSGQDRFVVSIGAGGICGFVTYWIILSLIKSSCNFIFEYSDRIQAESTSFLAASAIGLGAFSFCYALLRSEGHDKFAKLVTLAIAAIFILWLSYLVVGGNLCSPVAWKSYVVWLVAPTALAALILVGRDWLRSND